jgi:hypothetical protein
MLLLVMGLLGCVVGYMLGCILSSALQDGPVHACGWCGPWRDLRCPRCGGRLGDGPWPRG